MASNRKSRDSKERQRSARAVRNEEAQKKREAFNRAHPELRPPWFERKRERYVRRANDPAVQMQPRTPSGMIVCKDGSLKFDTVRARNDALVRASQQADEKAAVDLEKRTAKAKRARAPKKVVAPVTVRKSK